MKKLKGYFRGVKIHTEESKIKMRKPKSEETKLKMRKPKSEAHKKAISEALKMRKKVISV